MLRILALDTATRCCSAAAMIGERLAVEMAVVSERTHSVRVMAMIRETLQMAELELPEIDAFAISLGPGSFTGLRIGISTVQGLAFAGGQPCVGVSTLEALALPCLPWPHGICTLMDARQGEVYAGYFRERGGGLEALAPERVLPLTEALRGLHPPQLFVGNGAAFYRERIAAIMGEGANFAPPDRNLPRAGTVARLAHAQLAAGQNVAPDALVPRYLRQSDAELRIRFAPPDRGLSRAESPPAQAESKN
jgi:tRNA threonylcarbamoyladenosine biosynthesis protein TsaB